MLLFERWAQRRAKFQMLPKKEQIFPETSKRRQGEISVDLGALTRCSELENAH